jgi:uncharacterized Zn-binding protein involved in type VI secretion|tara:strand:- start:507 stop:797 length:291 start_codon:yes stop_codon:yes gene_type:complete
MAFVTTNIHRHIGHASPTPNPFHVTPYIASQVLVTAGGAPVIRLGDGTACGDMVVGCLPLVTIVGQPVHRLGDATSGHQSWPPNASAGGHPLVNAG